MMNDRLKIFTFLTGHGETLLEPKHEEHINQWLANLKGKVNHVTQSESDRQGIGHHVTICIWYTPGEAA